MSVSNDFSILNSLRPANAESGEVVCIELRYMEVHQASSAKAEITPVTTHTLGYSKRKSISVPASSNAYWNLMNLRALVTEFCSEKGINRETRSFLYSTLNKVVRKIHLYELEASYGHTNNVSHQYYFVTILHITKLNGKPSNIWEVYDRPMNADWKNPFNDFWNEVDLVKM